MLRILFYSQEGQSFPATWLQGRGDRDKERISAENLQSISTSSGVCAEFKGEERLMMLWFLGAL